MSVPIDVEDFQKTVFDWLFPLHSDPDDYVGDSLIVEVIVKDEDENKDYELNSTKDANVANSFFENLIIKFEEENEGYDDTNENKGNFDGLQEIFSF